MLIRNKDTPQNLSKMGLMKISLVLFLLISQALAYPQQQNPTTEATSSTNGQTEDSKKVKNAEVIEGTNMCSEKVECSCIIGITPVEINCQNTKLKIMYEQSDWLATLDAINLTEGGNLTAIFNYNEIKEVPRFPPLPIISLYLEHNLISSIEPMAFAELKQLEVLHLNNNNLTGHSLLESSFTGAPNNESNNFPLSIRYLNLSHNMIHSIGKDVFDHLYNLRSLDLSNNPLKTLEGSTSIALSSLRNLEFLGLANTGISGMHSGMLHDLNKLVALNLAGNEFIKVPEELKFAHNLTMLSLDRNRFETLDKTSFVGLDSLEELSLNNNERLKSVEEETFGWLKNLTTLELSYCRRLETLSDAAFRGIVQKENTTDWPVKTIILSHNGLSQVDEGLAPWDEVDRIDIRNNPFRCDCNLQWMIKLLVPRMERMDSALTDDLDCAKPKIFRGKSLSELMLETDRFARCKDNKDELYSEEISLLQPTSYRAAGITIIVIVVALTVIGSASAVFVLIKRRAISKALVAHQEIRYERADSDDDGIGSVHSSVMKSGSNRRTDVF